MAQATLMYPFATIQGAVSNTDKLYMRVLNGKVIIQHKPTKQSPKQKAAFQAFGLQYGTARKQDTNSTKG